MRGKAQEGQCHPRKGEGTRKESHMGGCVYQRKEFGENY